MFDRRIRVTDETIERAPALTLSYNDTTLQRKSGVMVITHNPVLEHLGGITLQQHYGWNNPDELIQGYIRDVREISHGNVNYEVVEHIQVDSYPLKKDGFRYNDVSFTEAWKNRDFHQPDGVDYHAILDEFEITEKVKNGHIDEVWLMGFPYCGYYESIMGGPGAFWCNAPALDRTDHASRRFVIMGFNYERKVGEMLEDLGHRAESMMKRVYNGRDGEANLWERFIRHDQTHPGRSECGNVHFAPNSDRDYDWGNRRQVLSYCDTWLKFPDLRGDPTLVDCRNWGNGDIRAHHRWWMERFPYRQGTLDEISMNWWDYIVDPNLVIP